MKVKSRKLKVKPKKTKKFRPPPKTAAPPAFDLEKLRDVEIDEDQLTSDLCRESFYDFVKEHWEVIIAEKPVWNWHIKYLCDLLQKSAENLFLGMDKFYDICINVPPGTSKSSVVSVMFPAWVWTRMPTARFICVSYRFNLSLRLSRKCRDVIKSDKYRRLFPEVEIRGDQDAKHHFANTHGGERYSAGSGGDVIGNHAHFIIVDDPIDPTNVVSEAELEAVNLWIEETLSGRKVDKEQSITVLLMQRLAQGDPTARMLSAGGVKHVCLPAVLSWAGKETVVKPAYLKKHYEDGLLDPVRLKRKTLEALSRKPRGDYLVAGQHLQCLVAGTLVSTARGGVPIERVTDRDAVHTRGGLRRVLWAGKTGEAGGIVTARFAAGAELSGTPGHPVWTENRGWVRLDSLRRRDYTTAGHLLPPGGTAAGPPGGGSAGDAVAVYDLAVEGVPEFFANGVLVHNCPTPPGGGTFKTDLMQVLSHEDAAAFLDPVRAKKNLVATCRFWDKAVTEGGGAYTVGVKMGLTRSQRLVVLDVKRFQYDSYKREREIRRCAAADGKGCVVGLEQEPGSGGKESAQNTVKRLMGYSVRVVKPTQAKTGGNRADAFSVQVNAGLVLLCPGAWNKEYVEELRYFPVSSYKDQVDASAGAFSVLWVGRRVCGGLKGKEPPNSGDETKNSQSRRQSALTTARFRGRKSSKYLSV